MTSRFSTTHFQLVGKPVWIWVTKKTGWWFNHPRLRLQGLVALAFCTSSSTCVWTYPKRRWKSSAMRSHRRTAMRADRRTWSWGKLPAISKGFWLVVDPQQWCFWVVYVVFRFFSSVFFVFKTNKVQQSISTNLSCVEHPILAPNFLLHIPNKHHCPARFHAVHWDFVFFRPKLGAGWSGKKGFHLTMTTWRITYFMAGVVFTGFLAWFLLLNRFLLVINSKEITFFAEICSTHSPEWFLILKVLPVGSFEMSKCPVGRLVKMRKFKGLILEPKQNSGFVRRTNL